MNTAEVLRGAAEVIEERGWGQVLRVNSKGKVCLVGAIEFARHGAFDKDDDIYNDPAVLAVGRHLGLENGLEIACWNDDNGRTQEEVVTALRAAADAVEAGTVAA